MEATRTMPDMFLGPTRPSATWVAPTLVVVAYVCWKISEGARARRMTKGGGAGSSSLPSPAALLPRWLPFLGGHTLQQDMDKLNKQLEGYADEFGGDYEQTIMGKRVVHVTGEEDIRRILLQRPSKFKRGMWPGQTSSLGAKVGMMPSLFFNEGKQWGRSRRLISPALSGHHNVANMIPAIAKIAHRLCSKLNDQDGEAVEFVQTFEHYTHDVIALVAFGFDADSVRATEDRPSVSFDAMHNVTCALMKLAFDPLSMLGWTMMPSLLPWARATKASTRRLHQVVEGAINSMGRQINEGVEPRPEDGGALLRKLISVQGGSDGGDNRMKYSDAEILPEVMGMFMAGSETTARTLCWAMYYLAKNPEMHARCREEALRVAPNSGGVVSTAEQLSQLVYCSAVFKESLRLWPVAPLLFMYSTEATTMENGMEFEAGTAYTLLVGHPALSENSFTKAKAFVPERWIEAEREEALGGGRSVGGDVSNDVVHREEAAFFFGAGPRRCPGESVATLEATIILAAICARFDLALAPGQVDPPESVMTVTAGVRSLELVVTRKASWTAPEHGAALRAKSLPLLLVLLLVLSPRVDREMYRSRGACTCRTRRTACLRCRWMDVRYNVSSGGIADDSQITLEMSRVGMTALRIS